MTNAMALRQLKKLIKSGKRCHMIGIGGISMSPLAEILHGMGIEVTGSDIADSETVKKLRGMGMEISLNHRRENVSGASYIIRTAAAQKDNVEIIAARKSGIPVFERAQAWGCIMQDYKNAVCVAGVHGKTTTTSMVSHILLAAEKDPTLMIGGVLPALGASYRVGKGDTIVLESCEYYNSFHNFTPTVAVVLNVDADHLDFFRDLNDLKKSFFKFASLVPADGHIVCNGDDANTMETLAPLNHRLFTFGLGERSKVRGVNMRVGGRNPSMDVLYDGKPFCHVAINLPGLYNLKNALAATAVAIALGIPANAIEQGLAEFKSAARRFEFKGSYNGADVYDDYAHHPSELRAMLDAVATLGYERTILVFQPHTFSRTHALFYEFVTELSRADITFLAEIYAAREKKLEGVSSSTLAAAVHGARCIASLEELANEVAAVAKCGDIVLTVGAGDVYKVGEIMLEKSVNIR